MRYIFFLSVIIIFIVFSASSGMTEFLRAAAHPRGRRYFEDFI